MSQDPPSLPTDRLDEEGWVQIEASQETLADLSAVKVQGYTQVYGDGALRERIAEATEPPIDREWRFFFATRLTFEPPPPTRVGPSMFASIVRNRAKAAFADRLRERGSTDVESTHSERLRVRSGERAHLTGYEATDTLTLDGASRDLPVEGWVAVWHADGTFRIAGGAYPATSLGDVLGVDVRTDPGRFRQELFELIRDVG